MKYIYRFFFITLVFPSVSAQQYTSNNFKDLFMAALSYHAVARVCGDSKSIQTSEQILRRVINFGEHKKLLSAEARFYIKNPDEVIARGEAQYKKDRYVGCSQANAVINQLNEVTKKLP
jgi:hypothetical protein